MTNKARDDFYDKDKKILAMRSAYRCNNPMCRRVTIMAHSDVNKYISIGQACHIAAAAPGGKRYDPGMTQEQRRSASENGIWLCFACGKLIDSDETTYTTSLLKAWKQAAEHETLLGCEVFPTKGKQRIVSVSNIAGGTGKSSCAAMLSYCLAKYQKKRVLCISAHPMDHALLLLGISKEYMQEHLEERLKKSRMQCFSVADIQEAILKIEEGLFGMDYSLVTCIHRTNSMYSGSYSLEGMIRDQMAYGDYDYVICDCGRGGPGLEQCLMSISTDLLVPVGIRERSRSTVAFLEQTLQSDRHYDIHFVYSMGRNDYIDRKLIPEHDSAKALSQEIDYLNQRENVTARIAHEIIPANPAMCWSQNMDDKKISNVRSAYKRLIRDELTYGSVSRFSTPR